MVNAPETSDSWDGSPPALEAEPSQQTVPVDSMPYEGAPVFYVAGVTSGVS